MNRNLSTEIKGNSVCILGYGREGRSVLQYLLKHYPKLRLAVADVNQVESVPDGVELHCGENYLDSIFNYDTIVRSPGISFFSNELIAARRSGTYVTSATNIFFSLAPGKLVAVTGTKGKSTTSALLAHLLEGTKADVRLVGNIGNPVLDSLSGADENTTYIVECSSYQLEDFHFSPDVAILLNIVEEHLDYHGSFVSYCDAKANMIRHQSSKEHLVCNPDWPSVDKSTVQASANLHSFGLNSSIIFERNGVIFIRDEKGEIELIKVDSLPVAGPGNLQNVMASITAALVLGASIEKLRQHLPTFEPLVHRMQKIAQVSGITFYDDSLSTIPEATLNALAALGDRVQTLLVGGFDRGLQFEDLAQELARSSVKTLICFPGTGEKIWQACIDAGGEHIEHLPVANMKEAVALAFTHTEPGKICLLSPASSSLNLFKDYRDRGEQFQEEIINKAQITE